MRIAEVAQIVKSQRDHVTILCWNSDHEFDCDENVRPLIMVTSIKRISYLFLYFTEHQLRSHANQSETAGHNCRQYSEGNRVSRVQLYYNTSSSAVSEWTSALSRVPHSHWKMSYLPWFFHSHSFKYCRRDICNHCFRLQAMPTERYIAPKGIWQHDVNKG